LEDYMGGLKQYIKHDILLRHPTHSMESMQFSHHIQSKNKDTHKSTIGEYTWSKDSFGIHKTRVPQPTRLKPKQMNGRREK
jgi:hypothetical protein